MCRDRKTIRQTLAGSSEIVLGRAGANLELTWGELEPTWDQLGAYLVHFSANLSQLGAIVGAENLEKAVIFIDFRVFQLCQPKCSQTPTWNQVEPDLVCLAAGFA